MGLGWVVWLFWFFGFFFCIRFGLCEHCSEVSMLVGGSTAGQVSEKERFPSLLRL